MNREIKFKAWDKRLERFTRFEWTMLNCSKEYDILQFTGLKDKNNKEIYEGDICKNCINGLYVEILFEEGSFLYKYKDESGLIVPESMEVISNIFENKDLL